MSGSLRGVPLPAPPNWWPSKAPAEVLTWSETLTPYMQATDVIESVAASIAPSGSGELVAQSISVLGQAVSLTLSGGQPGRTYTVQMLVTCTNGSVYQPVALIGVRAILPTDQPQVAPSAGFGTAIVWSGGVVSNTIGLVGTANIAAAGNSQATATQTYAVQNVVNAGSGGVVLPAISGLIYGTIEVMNTTGSDVLVYPASGDTIGSNAVNAPVTCVANSAVRFVLVQGASSWVVA